MSSTTRTRPTRTTADTSESAGRLRAVPDQTVTTKVRSGTEDKLWTALHANPNSTATDLSLSAEIGKSTTQKFLAKWASDGSVTRTAGIAEGGRRAADLWAITDIDTAQADPAPADTSPVQDAADGADAVLGASNAPDTTDATVDVSGSTELTDSEPTDVMTEASQDPVDTDEIEVVQAEPVAAADSEPGAHSVEADGAQPTVGGADAAGVKAARLVAGALRGMVEDFLRDHPGEEFGPVEIAKALGGKSSGAVSNALDKLVDNGTAAKTGDKPRRFTLAPAEQAAVPVPSS
jgi:hypothetical protein